MVQNIKFNKRLTEIAVGVMKKLDEVTFPANDHGFNKCFLFMQILHSISHNHPELNLPYYWFKNGVVVDPESLMLMTHGTVGFRWESDCLGCQIEEECPCNGNPHNNEYARVLNEIQRTQK